MPFANARHHKVAVGDIEVVALNDGILQGSTDLLLGVTGADAERMLTAAHRPLPPRLTVNAFLVKTGGSTLLIDAGGGALMGDAAGHMIAGLSAVGVSPGAIDAVLMTHLHVDHVGGLADVDGQAVFPNAELVMPEAEAVFWLDQANAARAPEAARPSFGIAQRAVAPYRERTRTIAAGEAARGITIEPLHGHSPGHSGYLVASDGASLLIWGDIVHVPALQFAHPGIGVLFDADAAAAQATRRRVLDRAAGDRQMVAGMHHDFPCFGHVDRHGDAYAFVPEVWAP